MSSPDQETDSQDTPQVKKRRAPKGEMRRTALLDAATEVFARDGYVGASMRDIADIAGITTVGLLHHFPNKVTLLRAVLDRRDQRVIERFGALADEPTLKGFLAFLMMGMRFSIEDRNDCQASIMITTESLSSKHPAWPWYKEKFELTHVHARAHLQSLVQKNEIRSDFDVESLAFEIFSVMDGLQIQWLRSPDTVDVISVFARYLQRLEVNLLPEKQVRP